MKQFFDKKCPFEVGDWRFYWDNNLFITGGFIDPTKTEGYYVHNPYQVIAAAASKTYVNVLIGHNPYEEKDYVEIPIDFNMNNIHVITKE